MKINGRWFQIFSIMIAILFIVILAKNQHHQVKGIMGNAPLLLFAPQIGNSGLTSMLIVEKIHVKLGQMLNQNDPIITLKSLDIEKQIKQSEQNLMLYQIDQHRQTLLHELSQLELTWRINQDVLQIKQQKKEIDLDLSSEIAKLTHLGSSLDRLKNAVQSGLMAQDQLLQVGAEVSVLEKRIPLLKIQKAQLQIKQPTEIQKIAENLAQKELDYLSELIQREKDHHQTLIHQRDLLTLKAFQPICIQQIFVNEGQSIAQNTQMFEVSPHPQIARLWVHARVSKEDLSLFKTGASMRIFNHLGEAINATISQNTYVLQSMPYPLSIDLQHPEMGYLLLIDLSQVDHPFMIGQQLTAILEKP